MMFAFGLAFSIVSRTDFEIDLAFAERAVAAHVLPALEVLEVHVVDDLREVLDELRGVGAALLRLADVGREMHVARVDRVHHVVGLFARFDGSAGVLMQAGAAGPCR